MSTQFMVLIFLASLAEGSVGIFLKCCPLSYPEWCQDLISFQIRHGEEILKMPQQLRQNNFAVLLLDELKLLVEQIGQHCQL